MHRLTLYFAPFTHLLLAHNNALFFTRMFLCWSFCTAQTLSPIMFALSALSAFFVWILDSARFVASPFIWLLLVPLQSVFYHSILGPATPRSLFLYSVTYFLLTLRLLNLFTGSVLIHCWFLKFIFFGSVSHACNGAPVTFIGRCVHNDTAYNVTHILFFPEATIQVTLDDDAAVHFPYRSAQWLEFAL